MPATEWYQPRGFGHGPGAGSRPLWSAITNLLESGTMRIAYACSPTVRRCTSSRLEWVRTPEAAGQPQECGAVAGIGGGCGQSRGMCAPLPRLMHRAVRRQGTRRVPAPAPKYRRLRAEPGPSASRRHVSGSAPAPKIRLRAEPARPLPRQDASSSAPALRRRLCPFPPPRGSCRATASRTRRATSSPHDMRGSRCESRSFSRRSPCSHSWSMLACNV